MPTRSLRPQATRCVECCKSRRVGCHVGTTSRHLALLSKQRLRSCKHSAGDSHDRKGIQVTLCWSHLLTRGAGPCRGQSKLHGNARSQPCLLFIDESSRSTSQNLIRPSFVGTACPRVETEALSPVLRCRMCFEIKRQRCSKRASSFSPLALGFNILLSLQASCCFKLRGQLACLHQTWPTCMSGNATAVPHTEPTRVYMLSGDR